MLRRCPNCNSTRLIKNKNLIKCKKCGYTNNQYKELTYDKHK